MQSGARSHDGTVL
jgi:hypothetical protein